MLELTLLIKLTSFKLWHLHISNYLLVVRVGSLFTCEATGYYLAL